MEPTLVTWQYNACRNRYIFTMSNRRNKVVKGIKGALKLEEDLLKEVLLRGVRKVYDSPEAQRLLYFLKKRFVDVVEEEEEVNMLWWILVEDLDEVHAVWEDGSFSYHNLDEIISSENIEWLQEFIRVEPSNLYESNYILNFWHLIKERLVALKKDEAIEAGFTVGSNSSEYESNDINDEDYFSEEALDNKDLN